MADFSNKTSTEEYYLGFDFQNVLGTEAVSSATVTVYNNLVDVTSSMITANKQAIVDQKVMFWIKGGTSRNRYRIVCSVTGSEGSKYETSANIRVLNS
jgi:HEAT repeat protein